ncbi:hypothetical protein [Zeimonas sediminis]|nr:hypothetical protein [Zeimonas sediminis]
MRFLIPFFAAIALAACAATPDSGTTSWPTACPEGYNGCFAD